MEIVIYSEIADTLVIKSKQVFGEIKIYSKIKQANNEIAMNYIDRVM